MDRNIITQADADNINAARASAERSCDCTEQEDETLVDLSKFYIDICGCIVLICMTAITMAFDIAGLMIPGNKFDSALDYLRIYSMPAVLLVFCYFATCLVATVLKVQDLQKQAQAKLIAELIREEAE